MTTLEAAMKLNYIFKSNGWAGKDNDNFIFDRFCELFDNLSNDEERQLMIELADRYSWISYQDYNSKIIQMFEKVEYEKLNPLKKIYLFPIMKPEDEHKIKSGHSVVYSVKALTRLLSKYKNINFETISHFKIITDEGFLLKENESLFLIDDYIGTGETIEACLGEIAKNGNIPLSKINILSIASQEKITRDLEARGIAIYYAHLSKRGISDFNVSPDRESKINLMLTIEKMISGSKHFSLGYNHSEALITLMRTPDNTFPIFWKQYKKKGKIYDAPFSREHSN